MTTCRGIRGATTAAANDAQAILEATGELLATLVAANGIEVDDLASALFSLTPDLDAAFPAMAARALGWVDVPLFDVQEVPVPGSLPRCIRVLLHWNTERPAREVVHVYLRGARALRPDLAVASGETDGPDEPGSSEEPGPSDLDAASSDGRMG